MDEDVEMIDITIPSDDDAVALDAARWPEVRRCHGVHRVQLIWIKGGDCGGRSFMF
jgi:hypothetical protein